MNALPGKTIPFDLNGAKLLPLASGALYWPVRKMLIVADLHLEKGSAYARTGQLLPPYDSRATLAALEQTMTGLETHSVICLGDSFHDEEAAARLDRTDVDHLSRLMAGRNWIWIAGNHDPAPPAGLGGETMAELVDGPLVFRHEAEDAAFNREVVGELSGHFHPKARVATRARRITGRCFVEDGRRAILPSFGAYTGGLDVRDPAIQKFFGRDFRVHLLAAGGVFRFPASALSR